MVTSDYVSVFQASTYYEKDNYYQVQIGEYRGALKDILKLGDLDHKSFQQLLQGISATTGEMLVRSKDGQDKQRAGIDITMSAPKSFSILVELAAAKNDTKLLNSLLEVWDKSVNTTLDHIEKEYSYTRIQKNNKRKDVKTGNCLFTKFQHDTARPVTDKSTKIVSIDPDLHTHNLLLNFTKAEDGKYRSVQAKKLLNSNLINGRFLRSELAVNIQKDLNIDIVITDVKQGFFELEHVPHILLDEYSSRSKQIEEKLEELRVKFPNMDETKLHKKAVLSSRESKKIVNIERDEIRKNNLLRAEKLVNVDQLLQKFKRTEKEISKPVVKNKIQNEEAITNIAIQNTVKNSEREVKKLPKYKQDVYSVLGVATTSLLGKVRASDIFLHVKKSEEVKQQEFKNMHEILINSLQSTKLDTQKLFASLKTPDIKIKIEENFENARARTPDHRNRLTSSYRDLTDTITRAKQSHYRDVADIATTTERGVTRTDIERTSDVDIRRTRGDDKTNVITINDIRRANELGDKFIEREREKKQKGVER